MGNQWKNEISSQLQPKITENESQSGWKYKQNERITQQLFETSSQQLKYSAKSIQIYLILMMFELYIGIIVTESEWHSPKKIIKTITDSLKLYDNTDIEISSHWNGIRSQEKDITRSIRSI